MSRARQRARKLPTWGLRVLLEIYDKHVPANVRGEDYAAMKEELLARELPSIADESGGHPVAHIRGRQ